MWDMCEDEDADSMFLRIIGEFLQDFFTSLPEESDLHIL
jgi:hypothetical protein